MSKITLDFFGEELLINTPNTLVDLRNQISSSFLLSQEDSLELILSYYDENSKISHIQNENDYNTFLQKKISKINLDISEESKIYKQTIKKQEEQLEKEKDKKRLEELLKLDDEMEKPIPGRFKKEEDEIKEINEKLNQLKARKNVLINIIHKGVIDKNNKQSKIRREIVELQEKLGLPLKYNLTKRVGPFRMRVKENVKNVKQNVISPLNQVKDKKDEKNKNNTINITTDKPKKEECKKKVQENSNNSKDKIIPKEKKEMKPKEEKIEGERKNVHIGYICDGCGLRPIVGVRYKCAVCHNFDFCEKCEKIMAIKHGHPMLKIKSPNEAPLHIKCTLKEEIK